MSYNFKNDSDLGDIDTPRTRTLIRNISRFSNKGYACDIGCGDGRIINLYQQYFHHIDGIETVKEYADRIKNNKITVINQDIISISPPEGKYDFIICSEVIEHLTRPDILMQNISKMLKLGGKVILTTPNLAAWYNRILLLFGIQPKFLLETCHYNVFTKKEFIKFVKDYFNIVHIENFGTLGNPILNLINNSGICIVAKRK